MMLRNLLDEVRNRRMLAIAALGVLVALAVPLLFLKSAPDGAPAADTAAPAAAREAKLPPRAARLLATSDAGGRGGRADGAPADPFNPPAAYRAAAAAAGKSAGAKVPAAASTGAGGRVPKANGDASVPQPVPVVVKNPGSTTTPIPASNGSTPRVSKLNSENASVDIRFGGKADTRIRRAIPRKKGLYIHGKLVAMYVKYSPSREAAVFALAPGLHISGDVKCRVRDGACRYVDIPAGAHAWIATIMNHTVVKRRLDVVRIKRRTRGSGTRAAAASGSTASTCMLRRLVAMDRGDALLDRDACKN